MEELGAENLKLVEEAFAAQTWFMEQVEARHLSLPDGFIGMKNMILQMTLSGNNRGNNPRELAELYLARLARK